MIASDSSPNVLPQRLCSEVQLFDLCDLESCRYKSGRFCTEPDLLRRFEKISENEIASPERYISEEIDELESDDSDFYDEEDNELEMDDFDGGEDDRWQDD